MTNPLLRLIHRFRGHPFSRKTREAVLGSIFNVPIWEQHRCTCGQRFHLRRDSPGESFYIWDTPPSNFVLPDSGGGPVSADLRDLAHKQ